jgi:hypothetical protein
MIRARFVHASCYRPTCPHACCRKDFRSITTGHAVGSIRIIYDNCSKFLCIQLWRFGSSECNQSFSQKVQTACPCLNVYQRQTVKVFHPFNLRHMLDLAVGGCLGTPSHIGSAGFFLNNAFNFRVPGWPTLQSTAWCAILLAPGSKPRDVRSPTEDRTCSS